MCFSNAKRVVHKNDAWPGSVDRAGFGDQHHVIEPGNAGLQLKQLFLRLPQGGHVTQINRHALFKRIGAQRKPFAQAGVKVFELQVQAF